MRWTIYERLLGLGSVVFSGLDCYTTLGMLSNPDNWELNPILGRHPTNREVVFYMILSQVVVLWIADRFPRLRKYILGLKFLMNAFCVGLNLRLVW